ncbi:MAG: hypothetical protein IKK85_04405 [Clostridia bacterium]|nr:hypothetical protein [Clostridia bacterium]
MNTNSIFNSEVYKEFYLTYVSDKSLAAKLAKMPERYNVEVDDAKSLAEECMRAVSKYEYVMNQAFEGNIMELLESAMDNCGTTVYERIHHLHQVNFCLGLYDDRETVERILGGASVEDLFEDYMAKNEKAPLSEIKLKQEIRGKISHISLCDKDLTAFITSFESNRDMLRSAADLSKRSYEIKCIAAMDEYLRGNSKCMELAAYIVCKETDLQSISDALRTGAVTDKKAQEIIGNIGIALLILGAGLLVSGAQTSYIPFIFAGVVSLIASFILFVYPDRISNLIGAHFAERKYENNVAKAESEAEFDEFIRDFADCDVYDTAAIYEDDIDTVYAF